jgi:heat shock protein HslJ
LIAVININVVTKFIVTTVFVLLLVVLGACTPATVTTDSSSMHQSQSLTGSAWWVEDIGGRGVIDMTHTTIEFGADGKLAGDTGCNRYFGSYEILGKTITVGPLAGTRKACAASLMDQESKFFQAMENITQWEIAETGLLHLRDEQGKGLLRASEIRE